MTNAKISALTSATTPLAGTETLPVVQSSTTKQVSVANLTAGRAVSAASLALTTTPLPVSSGGTGLSSVTAGYVPFGSSSTALSTSANLFWNTSTNTLQIPYVGVNTTFQSGYYAAINGDTWFGNSSGVQIGSVKNNGGWFDFNASANVNGAQISTAANTPVRVVINGTETWRFDTSQNIAQGVASKGINFTANTPAAGKTSQLLNWYEEGTFTPTIFGDVTAGVTTYGSQNGRYTRVGNLVTFKIDLIWTNQTGSGSLVVGGLPFTSANDGYVGVCTMRASNLTYTAGASLAGQIQVNSTNIYLIQSTNGATVATIPIDTAATITLCGSYFV